MESTPVPLPAHVKGTLAETAAKMARRTLAFEPGTKWQYSPGLSICGRIVEVASGQPYEEFVAARILRPLQIDFLIASSYGSGKESSGVVRLVYDPDTTLRDRHVLVVEDIVDSGRTLARLLGVLRQGQPRSLAVCALLHKRLPTALQEPVRFVGFDAPHEFLVGYGLDHAEDFRHLPYIGAI